MRRDDFTMYVAEDPIRVRAAGQAIRKQVGHLTGLLDDLIDVSRITSGMVEIARAPVNIAEVLNDAMEQVGPSFERRAQRFILTQPSEEVYVDGDRKRLIQAMTNLLNNATKYSAEKTLIRAVISLSGKTVQIDVSDSGVGIDIEFLPHVFDLFAQSKRSSARSEGGLGLGLSLVKSLVELHGGSVSAKSGGPNLGSQFTVSLPRSIAAHPVLTKHFPPYPTCAGRKIRPTQ